MMPYPLLEDTLSEEERIYYHTALSDFCFARRMLWQVGQDERRRFSQVGWPYGDSSVFGGHPFDTAEAQLCNLLYILFGAGFSGELFNVPADDEDEMLPDIHALDGGPLRINDPHFAPYTPAVGGDYEEVLITEIRAYQTGGSIDGPTGRERIQMLTAALRAVVGEAGAPCLHRWREDSNRTLQQSRSSHCDPTDDHVLLLCGFEPFAPQELMQEYLFEILIKAHRHRDPNTAPTVNDAALDEAEPRDHPTTLAEVFASEG